MKDGAVRLVERAPQLEALATELALVRSEASAVLRKLAVDNRRAAATVAHEHGLTGGAESPGR